MNYDEKLCNEKHENIKLTLKDHEDRLNGHSKRIDVLEQNDRENHTDIKNLIKKMDTFINVIMWGLSIFVTVSIRISQEELDHFRETICGKINLEIKDSQILAPSFDGAKDIVDVKDINKIEKTNVQNQVQSTITALI